MTAAEYIAHLQKFPPDAVVLANGEWGDPFEAEPPQDGYAVDTGGKLMGSLGQRVFKACTARRKGAVLVVYVG